MSRSEVAAKTGWVLVVDDNRDIRESVAEVLSFEGYPCRSAVDGQDALAVIAAAQTPPALVLLDLNMPVMGGREFLRRVANADLLPDTAIVVFAAVAEDDSLTGIAGWVQKPVDLDDLLAVVARHVLLP